MTWDFLRFCWCWCWGCSPPPPPRQVERGLGLDLPPAVHVSYSESHGGFHGDGATVITLHYTAQTGERVEAILEEAGWRELPATDNLRLVMEGGLSDELALPDLDDGLWYFYDRHSQSTDPADDSSSLSGPPSTSPSRCTTGFRTTCTTWSSTPESRSRKRGKGRPNGAAFVFVRGAAVQSASFRRVHSSS